MEGRERERGKRWNNKNANERHKNTKNRQNQWRGGTSSVQSDKEEVGCKPKSPSQSLGYLSSNRKGSAGDQYFFTDSGHSGSHWGWCEANKSKSSGVKKEEHRLFSQARDVFAIKREGDYCVEGICINMLVYYRPHCSWLMRLGLPLRTGSRM